MSVRSRLVLDAGLLVALLVAFNPAWTGIAMHEWLAVAVIVPLLWHLIINWEQTLRFVDRFVARLRAASRVNLIVDAVLFVSSVAVMVSGLMVSQAIAALLGLSIAPDALWVAVHSFTADLTVVLLCVHFALHWRWMLNALRRVSTSPARY